MSRKSDRLKREAGWFGARWSDMAVTLSRERQRQEALLRKITGEPEPPPKKQEEPQVDAPVFSQCVIGYREWLIDAFGQLRPITMHQTAWAPGVNSATCELDEPNRFFDPWLSGDVPPRHKAPHKNCQCGLYARFDLAHFPTKRSPRPLLDRNHHMTPPVIGAVAAWGDVQVHADGFRAEHACVLALAFTKDDPPPVRDLIIRVAREYRVPALPRPMLEAEACMHGSPIPPEFRPKPAPDGYLHAALKQAYPPPAHYYKPPRITFSQITRKGVI